MLLNLQSPSPQADFNFGQFLQAENLPASLFTVRRAAG
jgi:hypothetical protein